MGTFDVNNHDTLDKLYFHDAELGNINVSYKDNRTTITLIDVRFETTKETVHLIFTQVTQLHVPMEEPWGGGYYCASLVTERDGLGGNTQFRTRLQLNSGDEITVVAKRVDLSVV